MKKKSDSIHAKTYDSVAKEYRERLQKARAIKKETTQILLDYLEPGNRVLDLGCAVGYDTKMLARKCNVLGLDISPEMVKLAQQENARNHKVKIIQGDFLAVRFKEKFDGIFANAFIHLFSTGTDRKVFEKMRVLLREGGVAYIATTRSKKSREGWYYKKDYKSKEKRFRKYWRKTELSQALQAAGFKIIRSFEFDDPFGKHQMNFIVQK